MEKVNENMRCNDGLFFFLSNLYLTLYNILSLYNIKIKHLNIIIYLTQ